MTTPVRFVGQVPANMLDSDAREAAANMAQEERRHKVRVAFDKRMDSLRSALAANELRALTVALTGLTDVHGFSLVGLAVKEPGDDAQAIYAEVMTAAMAALEGAPMTEWKEDDVRSLALLESTLRSDELSVANGSRRCAALGMSLATENLFPVESAPQHTLIAMARRHILHLHQLSPDAADNAELDALVRIKGFITNRTVPWARPFNSLTFTRSFFDRALPLTEGESRQALLARADLDWLTPEQQNAELEFGSLCAPRVARFSGISAAQGVVALRRVVQGTLHLDLDALDKVISNFEEALTAAVAEGLFAEPLFDLQPHSQTIYSHSFDVLCRLAKRFSKDEATRLVNGVLTATIDQVRVAQSGTDPELGSLLAWRLVGNIARLMHSAPDSVPHFCESIAGLEIAEALERPSQTKLREVVDEWLVQQLRSYKIPAAASALIRAAAIDAGWTSLGDIRPSDLREAIVGRALNRRPERLAEIEDLDQFLMVANRLRIPVELPESVQESVRLAASMNAVIGKKTLLSANDALDGVGDTKASEPAPKRSRRARP